MQNFDIEWNKYNKKINFIETMTERQLHFALFLITVWIMHEMARMMKNID